MLKKKYKLILESFVVENGEFINKFTTRGTEGLDKHLTEICIRCQKKKKDEIMTKMHLNSFLIRIFCVRGSFEEIINSLSI
jgi:hypothetical protein